MDFQQFHNWVFKELGVNLNAYKQEQLNRRINSLMSRVGVKTLDEYSKLLLTDTNEKEKFLDFITINVTEFFRNEKLFEELEKNFKEDLLVNKKKLKIWSAACSIGCEPYTLAMILNEITPSVRHKIVATDIDNNIIRKAKEGIYSDIEMKSVNSKYLKKYFEVKDGKYVIDRNIKTMVDFKKHDLILDSYEKDFDLIVCRNVVIYFKEEIKREIFKKFSQSLVNGGLLFVGATESIYNYKEYGFEKVSTFIYKKV